MFLIFWNFVLKLVNFKKFSLRESRGYQYPLCTLNNFFTSNSKHSLKKKKKKLTNYCIYEKKKNCAVLLNVNVKSMEKPRIFFHIFFSTVYSQYLS